MLEESGFSKPLDRLSELPDSLIFYILSFLPIRDVICTTLLAKRWKGLWTSIPYLNFVDVTDDPNEFRNFVNRALILWKGTKILKFGIVFPYDPLASYDLDLWLHVAMENEVEELTLGLRNLDIEHEYYVPRRLYSCSFMTKLSLVACNLKIHGNVHWDQLKSLSIGGVALSEHVILQVLSGSPQLEVLSLSIRESHENLTIRSGSLKKLKIEKYLCNDVLPSTDTVLTIWAPNVETLTLSGAPYSKSLLVNVSSVTDATLFFYPSGKWLSSTDLFGEMMRQVLQSIHHVERVTLSYWCFKAVKMMKKTNWPKPPSEAKYLTISQCGKEIDGIVDLIGLFPQLTMLVIRNVVIPMRE